MYRARLLASLFVTVVVIIGSAAAKDSRTGKPVRNPERDQWLREHREQERKDLARERNKRQAMHRWDRAHNRRPIAVKQHDPPSASQQLQRKGSPKRKTTATKHHQQSAKRKQQVSAPKNSQIAVAR
jgi:hypothetical protein